MNWARIYLELSWRAFYTCLFFSLLVLLLFLNRSSLVWFNLSGLLMFVPNINYGLIRLDDLYDYTWVLVLVHSSFLLFFFMGLQFIQFVASGFLFWELLVFFQWFFLQNLGIMCWFYVLRWKLFPGLVYMYLVFDQSSYSLLFSIVKLSKSILLVDLGFFFLSISVVLFFGWQVLVFIVFVLEHSLFMKILEFRSIVLFGILVMSALITPPDISTFISIAFLFYLAFELSVFLKIFWLKVLKEEGNQ